MGLLRTTANCFVGFGIGLYAAWNVEESIYQQFKAWIGHDTTRQLDYLHVSSDLPLEKKREVFLLLLAEHGPSGRMSEMISEFKRIEFEQKALENVNIADPHEQDALLEREFRKYYPELFDEHEGYDFIRAMKLKLYCEDHYNVASFLRMPPK